MFHFPRFPRKISISVHKIHDIFFLPSGKSGTSGKPDLQMDSGIEDASLGPSPGTYEGRIFFWWLIC